MTNSYRKTPITGFTTAHTEKWWKRDCNRRRRVAERLSLANLDGDIEDPTKGEWGPKDGKQWIGPSAERDQWLGPHIEKVMRK